MKSVAILVTNNFGWPVKIALIHSNLLNEKVVKEIREAVGKDHDIEIHDVENVRNVLQLKDWLAKVSHLDI